MQNAPRAAGWAAPARCRTWRVAAVPAAGGGDAARVRWGPATRAYMAKLAALGVAIPTAWRAMLDEQWTEGAARHHEAGSSTSVAPGERATGTGEALRAIQLEGLVTLVQDEPLRQERSEKRKAALREQLQAAQQRSAALQEQLRATEQRAAAAEQAAGQRVAAAEQAAGRRQAALLQEVQALEQQLRAAGLEPQFRLAALGRAVAETWKRMSAHE